MPGIRKKFNAPVGQQSDAPKENMPLLASSSQGNNTDKYFHRWWKTQPWPLSMLIFCALVAVLGLACVVEPGLWKAAWYFLWNSLLPPTHPECTLPVSARWCRTRPGVDLACLHDDIVCDSICNWGYWEFDSIASMRFPYAPEGDVVDVGANVGWYSFLFASAGHTVHAFEALTSNVALLQASLCANPSLPGRIEIHQVALSDRVGGKCEVYSSERNVGDGALCCDMDNCQMSWNTMYRHRQSVLLSTLDSELLKSGIINRPLAFLKVDVEGLECKVFQGARETLAVLGPQYLMTEIWSTETGCSPSDFVAMLRNNKYKMVIGRSLGFPAASTDSVGLAILADNGPHNVFAQRFPWPVSKLSLLDETEQRRYPNAKLMRGSSHAD